MASRGMIMLQLARQTNNTPSQVPNAIDTPAVPEENNSDNPEGDIANAVLDDLPGEQTPEGVPEKIFPANLIGVKPRKKPRMPCTWIRNARKQKRQSGEEYVSSRGKIIPGRCIKPPCPKSCRKLCGERITHGQRLALFQHYWKLKDYVRKREFIHSNT